VGANNCLGVRTLLVLKTQDGKLTSVDDRSDFLEERMERYEEWINTAKVRHLHIFRYGDN
jgi:hypothetical protein